MTLLFSEIRFLIFKCFTDSEKWEGVKCRNPSGAPQSNNLIQASVQLLELHGTFIVLQNKNMSTTWDDASGCFIGGHTDALRAQFMIRGLKVLLILTAFPKTKVVMTLLAATVKSSERSTALP